MRLRKSTKNRLYHESLLLWYLPDLYRDLNRSFVFYAATMATLLKMTVLPFPLDNMSGRALDSLVLTFRQA